MRPKTIVSIVSAAAALGTAVGRFGVADQPPGGGRARRRPLPGRDRGGPRSEARDTDGGAVRKIVLLGTVGLALAVGVGFAANAISRDSIGLAATPAGSGI